MNLLEITHRAYWEDAKNAEWGLRVFLSYYEKQKAKIAEDRKSQQSVFDSAFRLAELKGNEPPTWESEIGPWEQRLVNQEAALEALLLEKRQAVVTTLEALNTYRATVVDLNKLVSLGGSHAEDFRPIGWPPKQVAMEERKLYFAVPAKQRDAIFGTVVPATKPSLLKQSAK